MEPVDNLNDKIKGLQKKIQEIQNKCKHIDTDIGYVPGKNYMRICRKCKKELGWPSPTELKEYLK